MSSLLVIILVVLVCLCGAIVASSQPVTFLSLGDWGGQQDPPYTTSLQIAVASQMGKTASSAHAQFLVKPMILVH